MLYNLIKLFKWGDIIILGCVLFAIFQLYAQLWFNSKQFIKADYLTLQFAQQPPQYYPLNTSQIIPIQGAIGLSLIEIKQGKARFIQSPCHNQYCIFHNWLKTTGDSTACLPNKISISLQGHIDYDAFAGGQ
jgi:hypothetical protein